MSAEIVIVGAGGHGRETLDIVEALGGDWQFAGFVDGGEVIAERLERRGAAVVVLDELDPATVRYVVGIGDSASREAVDRQMTEAGFEAATLVHPTATVGGDLRLAEGVVLAAGAHVTTNVTIGRHSQLNVGACVSHDCEVGHFVTLSPGVYVNGECEIGDGVFLGTGAIVTPRTRIGAGAKIGAGAVVLEDVPDGATVVGVPARQAS